MKRAVLILCVLSLVLGSTATVVYAECTTYKIEIVFRPSAIILYSTHTGNWATIHAAIPFSMVDVSSLVLNERPAVYVAPDNNGDLIAKFRLTALTTTLYEGINTLQFDGETIDGSSFCGEDTVLVRFEPSQ